MVMMDSSVLLLLLYPGAAPPLDPSTGAPLLKSKERIDFLLANLSEARIRILIPTPVLAEILVIARQDKVRVLAELTGSYAFRIQPFDEMAAIEVSELTDADLRDPKKLTPVQTVAKIKYDRQIIATAKVNQVQTIYSDDKRLKTCAESSGIKVVATWELPLPPEPPQGELELEIKPQADKSPATTESRSAKASKSVDTGT